MAKRMTVKEKERVARILALLDKEYGTDYRCYLEHDSRSEERRVGKECRSRWSPYH